MQEDQVVLCQTCNQCHAESPHTCPYREELYGDNITMCNCCSACENECCMDV